MLIKITIKKFVSENQKDEIPWSSFLITSFVRYVVNQEKAAGKMRPTGFTMNLLDCICIGIARSM